MKKNKLFKASLLLIGVFYIITYIISITSYYDYKLQEKTILTNEQIKLFESDVMAGKDVSLNDYVVSNNVDYTNSFTKLVSKTSTNVNKYLKEGIEVCFKLLNNLVSD